MRALVAHGPKDIRIESSDVEPLAPLSPGQVRVRMAAGGICGSDLHYYHDGGFGSVRLKQPMVLGHEVSGKVVAIGADVTDLSVDELVAISPSRPCGDCRYCDEALPNHCANMRFYGSAMPFPHIQGAFREELLVEASQCVSATGLTAGQAALAEPFAVTLHAAKRAGDFNGKRVLITGAGPIGCLMVAAAKLGGAAEIIVTDLTDRALEFAGQMGATECINMASNPAAIDVYQQGKGQLDVLFECSGAQPALVAGLTALRPRGIAVQLGLGGDMSLPMMMLTAKEIDLRGSFRFHEEFSTAVEVQQQGLVDLSALITHTMPFQQAVAAFELASDRAQAMKVQLAF